MATSTNKPKQSSKPKQSKPKRLAAAAFKVLADKHAEIVNAASEQYVRSAVAVGVALANATDAFTKAGRTPKEIEQWAMVRCGIARSTYYHLVKVGTTHNGLSDSEKEIPLGVNALAKLAQLPSEKRSEVLAKTKQPTLVNITTAVDRELAKTKTRSNQSKRDADQRRAEQKVANLAKGYQDHVFKLLNAVALSAPVNERILLVKRTANIIGDVDMIAAVDRVLDAYIEKYGDHIKGAAAARKRAPKVTKDQAAPAKAAA
jgi:hypothetical protein